MADSNSSRVFAGFFNVFGCCARGKFEDHHLWLSARAHVEEQRV
jgi:hypothetical protein